MLRAWLLEFELAVSRDGRLLPTALALELGAGLV